MKRFRASQELSNSLSGQKYHFDAITDSQRTVRAAPFQHRCCERISAHTGPGNDHNMSSVMEDGRMSSKRGLLTQFRNMLWCGADPTYYRRHYGSEWRRGISSINGFICSQGRAPVVGYSAGESQIWVARTFALCSTSSAVNTPDLTTSPNLFQFYFVTC